MATHMRAALLLGVAMVLTGSAMADETGVDSSAIEQELANWDSDEGSDTTAGSWNTGGFLEAGYGGFTRSHGVNQHDMSLGEVRAQAFANRSFGDHFVSAKVDIVADNVAHESGDNTLRADIRELFADMKLNDGVGVRLGQQTLTWGTGDYVFINDLFSKDWQSMLSGRDDSYLKKPEPAVKLSVFNEMANLDLVWLPVLTPDTYIGKGRFSYYQPMVGGLTDEKLAVTKPEKKLSHGSLAARLSKRVNGVEYALYGYHGLYSQPTQFDPKTGTNIFPKITSVGASVRGSLWGGIANAEVSCWDFRDDADGNNPFIPNDQVNMLVGYEHEIASGVTLGGQYMMQKMQDYTQAQSAVRTSELLPDEWHQTATLRLNWRALQDKLTVSLFTFYSPDAKDFYVKPKVSYRQDDHWFYEVGANVFGGKERHTQWGQFEDNSNVYARLRYNF